MKRRPGRKRLSGPRTASGRHIPAHATDHGTPETQRRRAWLAQRIDENGAITMGDQTLTSHPLGVLLGNGTLDQAQHDAGARYARLYCALAGRVTPPALVMDDDKVGRAPDDDAEREKRRRHDELLLRAAAEALTYLGRHAKDCVDNVAVYGRTPRWMLPVRPRGGDIRDADALVAGLEALAVAFGYRQRRAA